MEYPKLLLLLLPLIIASCSSGKRSPANNSRPYQAISAQGDTLYAPKLDRKTRLRYKNNLREAQKIYKSNPDSIEILIRYGKRTTELGQYRKAITIYSKGIEKHSADARLYQQRGRQYIVTRQFNKAVSDLEKSSTLMKKTSPAPRVQANIWINLGLAQYLQGNFKEASNSFQHGLDTAKKNNKRVKASYWLYMSLRRAGMDLQAGKVLDPITADMKLTKNTTCQKLLLVFKGDFEEKSLLNDSKTPLDDSMIGYGLGNWHYINGRKKRAQELFQNACDNNRWNLAGYIAAETDLKRLFNDFKNLGRY